MKKGNGVLILLEINCSAFNAARLEKRSAERALAIEAQSEAIALAEQSDSDSKAKRSIIFASLLHPDLARLKSDEESLTAKQVQLSLT